MWGQVTRGLKVRATVLNLAANELCDLSKSPDLFASLLFICKEGTWITQFLKFSPSVKIVISRISIICKTATFKSEVHLLMSLRYRKKFLGEKNTQVPTGSCCPPSFCCISWTIRERANGLQHFKGPCLGWVKEDTKVHRLTFGGFMYKTRTFFWFY